MKRVLLAFFLTLLLVIPVKAWEFSFPPQEHHAGKLSDAAVLDGFIYAIGVETYVSTFETVHLGQWVGNTTLFKIGSDGTPLAKYTILGGFCDEETWPSYGVESFGDEVIVSGMSCVPRFKNMTSWVMALDGDGDYRWGTSLPGYITHVKVWNGSVVVAIAYGTEAMRKPVILWMDPKSGRIERAYSLPQNHVILTFEIDENGEVIAAGYDEHMLSWAGIIYPNGTVRLWETGLEAWDGPSVWAVGNRSNFLIAVGWSNGTYLINPITGDSSFVEDVYPYYFALMNGSPVMATYYRINESILVRLNWNGSVGGTHFLGNFTVQFVSDGLMGGHKGWHYYLAPFRLGRETSLSLGTLPVEAKIVERTYSLEPINVSVESFEPVIITENLNGRLKDMNNSTPSNLTAVLPGANLTENCTTTAPSLGRNSRATLVRNVSLESSTGTPTQAPVGDGSSHLPLVLGFLLVVAVGVAYLYLSRDKGGGGIEMRVQTDGIAKVKAGRAFGISHVGARNNNEDSFLIMELPDAYLLAVADGLGGHNAGEVASRMAVETLREVFSGEYQKGMSDDEVRELLKKTHRLAHNRIKENAVGEREGMGTTLVSALVRGGKAIIANTGDSRAYLIRDGRIVERTKDHSLVQEMVDRGEITPEEAKRHPLKNIITKALGIDFGVDTYEWELGQGDVLLLSSDGLHDYVDEERIVEIASTGKTAEEIATKLVGEALPVTKDNVTVVVLVMEK